MTKIRITCPDCGMEFSENGIHDLADSIRYHLDIGECEETKSTLGENIF